MAVYDIIKKETISKVNYVWVQISKTEAKLMVLGNKTDLQIVEQAKKYNYDKKLLKLVQNRIEELQKN